MLKKILYLCSCLILFSVTQAATPKAAAKPIVKPAMTQSSQPLDQAQVKKFYGDGEFDPAIAILEDFQKTHSAFSREESLMVYKYLGVMYCADQGTREKGKSYFYKLLKIDPEAKILDLYVSIVVQDIFKNTLDELMGQKGFSGSTSQKAGHDDKLSAAESKPESKPAHEAFPVPKDTEKNPKPSEIAMEKSHAVYWWVGGVAMAAGAAGGFYLYSQTPHTGPETDILIHP